MKNEQSIKVFGILFPLTCILFYFLLLYFGYESIARYIFLGIGILCFGLLLVSGNKEIDEEYLEGRTILQIAVITMALLLIVDAVIRFTYGVNLLWRKKYY